MSINQQQNSIDSKLFLILEDLEGDLLKSFKLIISSRGLEGNSRQDGITYFGFMDELQKNKNMYNLSLTNVNLESCESEQIKIIYKYRL